MQQIMIDNNKISEKAKVLRDSRWLAERLGVSYETARALGRKERVPVIRIGKLLRYDPETIERFITANMSEGI